MKIWIDVLTPKQVLFFKPLKEELEKRGHYVYCTSRRYREALLMAEKLGLDVKVVGRHGGESIYEKLKASGERVAELADVVKDEGFRCAVSFSSPECARVAYGLKIKHICVSDSPHSESVSRLAVPLSSALATPWIIPYSAWTRFGIERRRVFRYKALDPAAWLKRRSLDEASSLELDLDPSRKTITVRLEESYAAYLQNVSQDASRSLLSQLVSSFLDCNLVALCRYDAQIEGVAAEYGSKLIVPRNVVDGVSLLSRTDVFIGMGGTMTAEAVLMGVPSITAYPGEGFHVENYLIKKGLLVKPVGVKGVVEVVARYLKHEDVRRVLREKGRRLLMKMEDPALKIADIVEKSL